MLCLFNSMVFMCAPLARVHDTYKVFADQRNRQFLVVGDAVLWEKVAAEGKATSALLQHRPGKDICGYELNDAALNRALRAALRTHLDRQYRTTNIQFGSEARETSLPAILAVQALLAALGPVDEKARNKLNLARWRLYMSLLVAHNPRYDARDFSMCVAGPAAVCPHSRTDEGVFYDGARLVPDLPEDSVLDLVTQAVTACPMSEDELDLDSRLMEWATWAWLTYGPEVFGTRP